MFQPQDIDRFDKLRSLSPVESVRAWIDGDFGIGDEPAMIEAIRKDNRIIVSDDEIIDRMADAMESGLDAATCLERLAKTSD